MVSGKEDSGGLKLCRGKGQVPEIAVLPAFYYLLRIAAQGFHGPYSRLVEVKGVQGCRNCRRRQEHLLNA